MNKKTMNVLTQIAKLLISLTFLIIIFSKIDISQLFENSAKIPFVYIGLAFILYLFSFMVLTLKWWVLIPNHNFWDLLHYSLIGLFYSTVIPGQIAGDGIKAYRLGKAKSDVVRVAFSVIIDKILGFIVIVALAITGIFFTQYDIAAKLIYFFVVFLTGMVLILVVITNKGLLNYFKRKVTEQKVKKNLFEKIFLKLEKFFNSVAFFSFRNIILNIFFAICFQLLSISSISVLSLGLGFHISFFDWFWIIGVLALIIMIPITIGGLGLREGSLAAIFTVLSISPDKAVTISLISFGLQLLLVVFGGILDVKTHFNFKKF